MKASISSDVWERKKAMIAKLYMEDEWPLKHVIKQIRSDDFNPSETQLRSRLKKWRVIKPSRQTRKKLQNSEDPESEKDSRGTSISSSISPRNTKVSPVSRKPLSSSSTTRSDWVGHTLYAATEIPQPGKWNADITHQLTPSPSGGHNLASERYLASYSFSDPDATMTSFDQAGQTSPVTEGLLLNPTSAVTPNYAAYPHSPESCIPSPAPTTAPAMAQWPPRPVSVDMVFNPAMNSAQWYGMPFEPISPPSGVPHSAPLTTPSHPAEYVVSPGFSLFSPEYAPYEMPEYNGYDAKHWKRTMSLQHEYPGQRGRLDHERKHLYHHSIASPDMVPIPAPQAGQHAVMCAPMAPYIG